MSRTIETKYTAEEFLEIHDSLSGTVITLEQSLDDYITTLGEYIAEETVKEFEPEHSIERTVDSLERVYSSMESLDQLIEDEHMVARIQYDGKKGYCNLEQNFERLSGGIYDEVNNLEDLLTLFEYIEEESFEADEEHLKATDKHVEAPTEMIHNRERIKEVKENLKTQYDRLIYSEVLAREHTENELTFKPEPSIFRMLGHSGHKDRINNLNRKVKKAQN